MAASVVLRGRMPDQTFWLYNDVPDSGVEITMTFENGLLATARMKPYDVVAPQESERQGWARDLMLEHVDRVTREFPDQRLTARPGWARLVEPDVLDFVLNTFASPRGGGLVGRQARRFGELDLIVSLYEFGEAERIRAAMPAGYPAQLASLAESFGLTQQRLDIAHWILGREPGGVGAVHLGYIPSAKDITGLLPTDLLSAEERESHLG